MMDDDGLRSAVRDLVADTHPPTDLLDRALTQATRRRRWLAGVGAAVACVALVGGSVAGAVAFERSPSHRGAHPAGDPTTATVGLDEIPADLTGKALANALGLPNIAPCGGLIMATGTNAYLCLPSGLSKFDQFLLVYQLRGYQRTETVVQLAQNMADTDAMVDGGEQNGDALHDLLQQRSDLTDQLYAEQGRHPYTGWESPAETTAPTTD